ncbi:MAG TPA: hypothetical protein DCS29_03245 [Candidatus Magasanikbacteria bacterium]|nr:MAG: hypothetical protein A2479_02850 [Candidatus Magasanikbacteria bacterium RIFOXYC2_FULL_39_8]HAT03761.1 hypothetical protein [Candidatus Magasanikbacteria bacterium]
MFWSKHAKKNKVSSSEGELSAVILTIPDIFYGGQDPTIYHTQEKVGLHSNNDMSTSAQVDTKKIIPHKTSIFSGKKVWIIGSIFLVVAVGIISWYYIAQYRGAQQMLAQKNQTNTTRQTQQTSTTTTREIIPTATSTVTVTSSNELPPATSTPSLVSAFFEFPTSVSIDTADLDSDSLTDIEEELFGIDSGTWDTDQDGYYDGQEIFNLYNPKGFAPVKLIDSGLVREYINPLGYRIYYPFFWQEGDVDPQERQVLFSAISGDYIEVRVSQKEQNQSFVQWFGRNAEGQRYADLVEFENRFKQKGYRRKDSLVAYFDSDTYVYICIYHPKDRGPIAFRHVMQMMYQSFRIQKTDIDIPDQAPLPDANASSTTRSTSTIFSTDTATNTQPAIGTTSTNI